jgi:exonuclease VII small subunit
VAGSTAAKTPARKSVGARLASAEDQFADIERLAKELRKRLDQVAETVRIVAAELGHRSTKR